MSSRFTAKAQSALDASLSFAREMGHTYIGTEHLLLGLLSVGDSMGGRILINNGVELDRVKAKIKESIGTGSESSVRAVDMTPMTKRVIEESARIHSSSARPCLL